ncbi:MAG: bifunctional ornithine acetyltransferase/N-acetylglutamate synthase, partial [Spirochaetia bacterium]|nr:bifunctional ornithine acetyltransferase/N-acetylglutamate synthase [Spirochaetia bacterium]
ANVCMKTGVEDSISLLETLAKAAGGKAEEYFPCSTGIIGWRLPLKAMKAVIPNLVSSLEGGTGVKLAKGIMTTDAFPKLRSIKVGKGRIVAVAKGAGMIEPNMATMLSYILTDISMSKSFLQKCLKRVADQSYNCISVDSDQSTSDSVILLSSGTKPAVDEKEFETALLKLCTELAEDIVRNAEGSGHVIKVEVTGAQTDAIAKAVGKAVINSPLVTTAVFGNDPNVGRLASCVGDFMGINSLPFDKDQMSIWLGKELVFDKGSFCIDRRKEEKLSKYMKDRSFDSEKKTYPEHNLTVDILFKLSEKGKGRAVVKGTDLSYAYVRENADYRS